MALIVVRGLTLLPPYTLELWFSDKTHKVVDLEARLARARPGGVFEPLKDPAYFALGAFDPEAGTVVWPNGADFAPEMLYAVPAKG